ncbi:hypothetical protein NDA16_001149 [Ustilago loliicola]|nr:hypothetical protein NDA16_001149 [Ustilago loliicola]
MFFHGIGIDLHFVYEGDVNSPDVSHIFNNYRHAGSKLRPDSSTRIGAFLLNEVDCTVPVLYNTPQGENVVLHTGHTCDSGRFLARVWRIRSLIDAAWGANDTEADEVILRAIRSGAPGQDAQILYESRPVKFSAYKPSVWVDAGLISEFPACDVSIVVKRPSTQQTITAIFKYTKSPGFLTQFPGEPISSFGSNASLNPRHVNAGSEDERQLDQFIEAFISKTRLDDVPVPASMSNAAAQTASPGASTRDGAPRSSQNTSPILAEQSVDSRDNNLCRAFNTSSPAPSEAHNGEEANTGDKAKAISSASSTASEDTLPLRSPPLAHRAWASISNIVSSRTTSRTASKHSRASSVAPSNSFATNEPQAEEETAPTQITETRASSPCESESDEAYHKNLTTLIKDITTLLDDATDAFDEHKWADTAVQTDSEDDGFEKGDSNADAGHMASESVRAGRSGAMVVEYGTQTEHSCGQAQVVGVSCPEQATGSISRGQAGDAMQECQPLVLPVGSVTTSESSGGAATATTTAEQPAVRVDNDVEMADVEATTSQATNAGTQPAQTLGDDHALTATLQPENGAQDAGQIQAA